MFRQRLLSALIGIPIVIFSVWNGKLMLYGLILLISTLALRELYSLGGLERKDLAVIGLLGNFIILTIAYLGDANQLLFMLISFFILLNIYTVFIFPVNLQGLMLIIWGKLYVTCLFAHFFWLRALNNGFFLLLSVLLATWASDTGAYACGLTLGKRKLIPAVSPKKSLEGAVGGILFAGVTLVLLAPLLNMGRLQAAVIGVFFSLVGQFGDLAESALKRWGRAKDSGKFLPGHGGVLDRLDSLLFAVPAAYYLFLFLL
ncbi:MAG: phosphatidate cytidylyltransferase [Firmicutes bacterium]|nr:phosphatidate cytidylyltransferase [Bacillota bacterium]